MQIFYHQPTTDAWLMILDIYDGLHGVLWTALICAKLYMEMCTFFC